ncbi:FG-GAP-like repeat-containing protein [Streptomyces sp. WMMC500]|uniref:FG-GAP-like repeat-containing protein n=1 Tax=Streptomyces sp. WMMC500 TaxID=3015154 RepID=UPI00248BD67F|nr:FG-GAP-like repeat-containing protein [Streptomyces sp. WMMC500]WBB60652.1 FG-GAP-like repeat-containing protein [Streptomyces sp. WMMC500]
MSERLRIALATATAAALTGGLFAVAAAPATADAARPVADLNGGLPDLVVSAPGAHVGGHSAAGQIVAHYGSAAERARAGLSAEHSHTFSQDSNGVPANAEADDAWGEAVATGDFDGDGLSDVAVGAPGEDITGDPGNGVVQILWGAGGGLSRSVTLADPRPSKHDQFGRTLETGDFDGDGTTDLAVGSATNAVDVFRGPFDKSTGTYDSRYVVAPNIRSGAGDGGGAKHLRAGDVNGDGMDDLVVAGLGPDYYDTNRFLPGSADGLTRTGEVALPAGTATDIGDLNSDGYGDVVTGLAHDAFGDGGHPDGVLGGGVSITYGSAAGPDRITRFDQDTPGVEGVSEEGDGFGSDLHLGDIDGDGHLDLAVGAPYEDRGSIADTGTVTVLYDLHAGEGAHTSELLHQNAPGVPNDNEADDVFGAEVHVGDHNGDRKDDVTVGSPGENDGNGMVHSLRSDGTTAGGIGASAIYPPDLGISIDGSPRYGTRFGG